MDTIIGTETDDTSDTPPDFTQPLAVRDFTKPQPGTAGAGLFDSQAGAGNARAPGQPMTAGSGLSLIRGEDLAMLPGVPVLATSAWRPFNPARAATANPDVATSAQSAADGTAVPPASTGSGAAASGSVVPPMGVGASVSQAAIPANAITNNPPDNTPVNNQGDEAYLPEEKAAKLKQIGGTLTTADAGQAKTFNVSPGDVIAYDDGNGAQVRRLTQADIDDPNNADWVKQNKPEAGSWAVFRNGKLSDESGALPKEMGFYAVSAELSLPFPPQFQGPPAPPPPTPPPPQAQQQPLPAPPPVQSIDEQETPIHPGVLPDPASTRELGDRSAFSYPLNSPPLPPQLAAADPVTPRWSESEFPDPEISFPPRRASPAAPPPKIVGVTEGHLAPPAQGGIEGNRTRMAQLALQSMATPPSGQQQIRETLHGVRRALHERTLEQSLEDLGLTPGRIKEIAHSFDPNNPNGLVAALNTPLINLPVPGGEFMEKHPYWGGIAAGASKFASGMTTPLSIILMVGTGGVGATAGKLIGAGFAATAAWQVAGQSADLLKEKDPEKQAELATQIILTLGMMGMSHDDRLPVSKEKEGLFGDKPALGTEPPVRPSGNKPSPLAGAERLTAHGSPGKPQPQPSGVTVLETLNTQPKAPAGVTAGGKGSDFMSNAGEPVQGGGDSGGEPPVSDYTKPRPQATPAPIKPFDKKPVAQPKTPPDFLKKPEEKQGPKPSNKDKPEMRGDPAKALEYIERAKTELWSRLAKSGLKIDTTGKHGEVAVVHDGKLFLNPMEIAERIADLEEIRHQDGMEWLKALFSEEMTHTEIDKEIISNGLDPKSFYADVFKGLSDAQRGILNDVYGPVDTLKISGTEVPISLEEQAYRYGSEWMRIERMLARGEKIPQDFFLNNGTVEALRRQVKAWRVDHPSLKTGEP
jgi:hypothetical protein